MTDRTAILEATLREMRVWIKHWKADRQCNLTPTDGSLHDALETIDRVLAGGESSRGPGWLAAPVEHVQPPSRYVYAGV